MSRLSLQYVQTGADKVEQVDVTGQTVYRVNWKKSKRAHIKYPFELDSTIYKADFIKKIINITAGEYPRLKKIFAPNSLRVKILKKFISMKDFLLSLDTFRNPNTLETYCYRWCKNHKRKVPSYLFFKKIYATALQINTVNTVVNKGDSIKSKQGHSIDELNEMYKKGYLVDIDYVAQQKPTLVRYDGELFRLKKY
jgi:hypothetical protein